MPVLLFVCVEEDPIFLNTNFSPSMGDNNLTLEDVQVHLGLCKKHIFNFKKLENVRFKEDE